MSLAEIGLDEEQAVDLVREARRAAVVDIEERLYLLEGKVAAVLSGPILIPSPRSPMRDAWDDIRHTLGTYAANFTIDGRRVFVSAKAGNVDGLDGFLERYDPGSPNVNDALVAFCGDLRAVAELRGQRGAIMRDGLDDPGLIAEDPYQFAALTGSFADAVTAVREVDEELRLAEHWDELDEWQVAVFAEELIDNGDECLYNRDMVDPVGIKEIAERLAVKRTTVDQWLQRGLLPASRWTVGGRPAWNWRDVERWAAETGRQKSSAGSSSLPA